jgi:hypothetical protein
MCGRIVNFTVYMTSNKQSTQYNLKVTKTTYLYASSLLVVSLQISYGNDDIKALRFLLRFFFNRRLHVPVQ